MVNCIKCTRREKFGATRTLRATATLARLQMIHNDQRNSLIASDGRLFYRLNVVPSWQLAVRTIWRFTGTPCSGSPCPGWAKLDRNNFSSQIEGNRVQLYQMYVSGHILRFNGTPCTGNVCPGWQLLDNNPRTRAIASH